MQDKTIISICLGITTVVLIFCCYVVYMVWGPGGDGVIFASVAASITGIVTFILGKILSPGGQESPQPEPQPQPQAEVKK